jgi:hypothetical protein
MPPWHEFGGGGCLRAWNRGRTSCATWSSITGAASFASRASIRRWRVRKCSDLKLSSSRWRRLAGHAGGWEVRFTGAETKNGRPLEFSWPNHLTTALKIYLEDYLRLLNLDTTGADLDRLWAIGEGRRLERQLDFRPRGPAHRDPLRREIRPHMFRKAAATLVSEADPENITDAAAILGHATIETTQRHYNRAGPSGLLRGIPPQTRRRSDAPELRAFGPEGCARQLVPRVRRRLAHAPWPGLRRAVRLVPFPADDLASGR